MVVRVLAGDCTAILPTLDADSFDSVVCDPPYHLTSIVKRFGAADAAPAQHGADGAYARASRGFMGKQWDGGDVAFRAETWAEVLRVLKPGGHLIAFGGTRTYHRLACAIEDAGFEIRDQIGWLFGSGFPKSHDVAKGIDKRRLEDVEPVRVVCRIIRAAMDRCGLKSADLAQHFGCHSRLIDHWAARDSDSQPSLPTPEQWAQLRLVLAIDDPGIDTEVDRLNARKGVLGDAWRNAEVVGEYDGEPGGFGDHRFAVRDTAIRAPATPEAAAWQGWGTALKPAWEPIVLARKPLIGTVVANVLQHGTGAINIDDCRVHGEDAQGGSYTVKRLKPGASCRPSCRAWRPEDGPEFHGEMKPGRWPANVITDGSDEVVAVFPDAPGQQRFVGAKHGDRPTVNCYGDYGPRPDTAPRGDSGTAARFFYSAKADATDRLGSKHPTVKPVDLMRYLCRLVTPPGGHVLDCFAGSGTTGMAAMAEGFNATLIEREAEYVADIRRRLAHVDGSDAPLFAQAENR